MLGVARVTLENISKSYNRPGTEPVRALYDLNLQVGDGEFLVVVGPSGSGKTTALRIIAGLEQADSGTVVIGDRKVDRTPPHERHVAMVFQGFALYPHMTVRENIAFGLKVRRVPRPEREQRIGRLVDMLELRQVLDRRPAELSGGEQQRTAIARALAREPAVLLMDEPFSNLDVPLRAQLRSDFARLRDRLAATIIHVTHDQAEAMILGERIAVMHRGQIVQTATPGELYRKPATRFVAEFFGSPPMNFFHGKLSLAQGNPVFQETAAPGSDETARVRIALQPQIKTSISLPSEVVLGLRPEGIRVGPQAAGKIRTLSAIVLSVQYLGSEYIITLAGAGGHYAARFSGGLPPKPGELVPVAFEAVDAMLFDPASGEALQ